MSKRLNQTDNIEVGDQVVLFKANCTDFRSLPWDVFLKLLLEWIESKIPTPSQNTPIIQHFYPNQDFNVEIENNESGTFLVLNPYNEIENGIITLPFLQDLKSGQELLVSCTQQIENLSFNAQGATLIGEPNAMPASGFFKLKFDKLSGTWYRVG